MTSLEAKTSAFPGLAKKLSRLIQFATVSSYTVTDEVEEGFSGLIDELPLLFPKLHRALKLEKPSDRALLYTWKGSDPSLAPAILCAHFDVVPEGNSQDWEQGAFSGAIVDGQLWGRGSQDIKVLMASIMEAAEQLLDQGFKPRRTILFAFGGDEEVGGTRGAGAIARHLAEKGVRASFLVDEGGPISIGMLSFAPRPLALVGVAEKGYADLLVTTKGKGGHASMPPKDSATVNLAKAIVAMQNKPFPARITGTLKAFLRRLSMISAQPYRFLFRFAGLTAPFIKAAFSATPTTNALIRSTVACTMLKGSPKENVLAEKAQATLNVRILPDESSVSVIDRLNALAAPFGAEVKVKHEGQVVEASNESSTEHEGWGYIEHALSLSHPEAFCLPFLFSAATDTKHYRDIAEAIYRFTALPQSQEDLARVHAANERVKISDLERCASFYTNLIGSL